MVLTREQQVGWIAKPAVFGLCLAPLAWLVGQFLAGGLGANPIEATNRFLGDWGLRFLLIALAVSPLMEVSGWRVLMRFRRMLGLFAFFYVSLHLTSYVVLDQFFDWREIWGDIVKRRYITVGMIAFVLMIPLAITSTKGMIKRLGGRRWKRLHMLVYGVAILAVFHFFMMVKVDIREPTLYAAILAALLGYRIFVRLRRQPTATRRRLTRVPAH